MSTRVHIVMSEELVARIDAALGPGQPRGDWVRRAVEQALGTSPGQGIDAATVGDLREPSGVPRMESSAGAATPTPAEQPDRHPRDVELDAWGASHDVEVRPLSRADAFRRATQKR